MTTKPNTEVQASESSGSAILAQHPPNVFAGSHLLASSIPLPPHPLICCSVFTPTHSPAAPESLTLLENARKQVVLHNREALLVESLLPKLLISKDCVALYIFTVGSEQQMSAAQRSLAECSFSGLECEWSSPNFTLSPVFILYIHDQAPNVTTSPRVESTLALSLAPCCWLHATRASNWIQQMRRQLGHGLLHLHRSAFSQGYRYAGLFLSLCRLSSIDC